MHKIFFATTNEGKLKEARELLSIEIEGAGLDIDEIQSLDPREVVSKKGKAYFDKLSKPILVEDVSLTFLALGKLPGPYINDFSKSLKNEGLIKLLEGYTNREATAQTSLAFYDESGNEHIFEGIVQGTIATECRGTSGFGWDPIFIPNGETLTFAQMKDEDKNKYSMRARAFEKFREWLNTANR